MVTLTEEQKGISDGGKMMERAALVNVIRVGLDGMVAEFVSCAGSEYHKLTWKGLFNSLFTLELEAPRVKSITPGSKFKLRTGAVLDHGPDLK